MSMGVNRSEFQDARLTGGVYGHRAGAGESMAGRLCFRRRIRRVRLGEWVSIPLLCRGSHRLVLSGSVAPNGTLLCAFFGGEDR